MQIISCDGDSYVLIWALRRPPSDTGVEGGEAFPPAEEPLQQRVKSTGAGWTKLKLQSALPASVTATGKYSPAVGKYQSLDKSWKPVQKIKFLKPHGAVMAHSRQEDEQLFRVLITSMCVVVHPEMQLAMGRKDSAAVMTLQVRKTLCRRSLQLSFHVSPFPGLYLQRKAPEEERKKTKDGGVDFKGKGSIMPKPKPRSRSRSRSSSGDSSKVAPATGWWRSARLFWVQV